MTACITVCRECRTNHGRDPKRWRWLCESCATEHADNHRRTTGHAVELAIANDAPDRPRRVGVSNA